MEIKYFTMKPEKLFVFFEILSLVLLFSCGIMQPKGPARWSGTLSSQEAKERDVFYSYYEAEPFYYEDSICKVNLVFKEVFAEYWHWYDEKAEQWRHTQDKYMVATLDTLQSDLGVISIDSNQTKHWCWSVKVSCYSEDTRKGVIVLQPNRSDILQWDTISFPVYTMRKIDDGEPIRLNLGDLVFIKKDVTANSLR